MATSKYRMIQIKEREEKAINLYKQGFSVRQVGNALGRSHNWVWLVMKKYGIETNVDNLPK